MEQHLKQYIDLYVGLICILYAVGTHVLKQQGIIDLDETIATSYAAGAFALAALTRFYKRRQGEKEDE